jgi:hypothetical protein
MPRRHTEHEIRLYTFLTSALNGGKRSILGLYHHKMTWQQKEISLIILEIKTQLSNPVTLLIKLLQPTDITF